MQNKVTRALLVLLGLLELVPGAWAALTPTGFYQDFPGFRHGWVSMDGPFNEHLIRDFGGLNLAVAAFLIGAAVMGTTLAARIAAIATLLFGAPHFVYHLGHIEHFEQTDKVLIVATTALLVVLPLALLVMPARRTRE